MARRGRLQGHLAAALALVFAPLGLAQPQDELYRRPQTPAVSGTRLPDGIRITSRHPENAFALDLPGEKIIPTAVDGLVWDINGITVQLLVAKRAMLYPALDSERAMLEAFQRADVSRAPPPAGAVAEAIQSESGHPLLYWVSGAAPGGTRECAAAINGDYLVLLVGTTERSDGKQPAREFLVNAMRTFTRGVIARSAASPDSTIHGAPLPEVLRLHSAITGKRHTAVLNQQLGTHADSGIGFTVDPTTQMELLHLLLAARRKDSIVASSVFDGALAHAINLVGFDSTTREFVYWDPWGEGSFLQHANNRAGVDAKPHPSVRRNWLVPEDQLRRVLYAIIEPQADLFALLRLCTLLCGTPEAAVAEYRNHRQQEAGDGLPAEQLRSLQDHLEQRGCLAATVTVFRMRTALSPEVSAEAPALVDRLKAGGKTELVSLLTSPSAELAPPARSEVRLEAAKQSEFFQFFNLEQVASAPAGSDGTLVAFRPKSSSAFRNLVELKATVHDGAVTSWRLSFLRSFIDDREQGLFAADFAKSFLEFVVPQAGSDPIGNLIEEIWNWPKSERRQVPVPGAAEKTGLPAMPSPGYLVYLGLADRIQFPLANGRMRLLQQIESGVSHLVIEVGTVP